MMKYDIMGTAEPVNLEKDRLHVRSLEPMLLEEWSKLLDLRNEKWKGIHLQFDKA